MHSFADDLVTTPEVHTEIKDKQSKQTLATLPFGISVQEPTEESRTAGEKGSAESKSSCLATTGLPA